MDSTREEEDDDATMDATTTDPPDGLPEHRFALELEFVEALASPAYLHFLANLLRQEHHQAEQWQPFLRYLYQTYSQPEYARFLRYPHALFFLQALLEDDASAPGRSNNISLWTEWTQPGFRNFCHQQQFLAWQYRHATCYGVGDPKMKTTLKEPTHAKKTTDTAASSMEPRVS